MTTSDGVDIYYKDWGLKNVQPIVFHHGWPLSADDWDPQMLYTSWSRGIASSPMTGAAMAGRARSARGTTWTTTPPIMVQTPANPGGLPIEVFDGLRQQLAANRAQFYLDLASGPFYGYNRPGAQVSLAVIENWWRQGMMGGAKAHDDGIRAFSDTDFTEDLTIIDVPTLVMHGDDEQIVPIADSALLSVKLLKTGTLKVYEKFPHGMGTTHADVINADLLAFIKG
jgi:non-heme chloroperoxidase